MDGIDAAEIPVSRGFLAEISLSGPPAVQEDGSVLVQIEALTLED